MGENNKHYFLNWPEAFEAGTQVTGGKGWNLGKLERYGFKIPAGGVLSGVAYTGFVVENSLGDLIGEIAAEATIENIGEKVMEEKLARLREEIRNGSIPLNIKKELERSLKNIGIFDKPSAVRSSASTEDSPQASFAGIHESYLNVCGFENILSMIRNCYASIWNERAIVYRRKMNIKDHQVLPAVVITEMVNANASGIAFTCDPLSGRQDTITINTNYGLGECIVGGIVDPDRYYLDSSPCHALPQIVKKVTGRKEGMTVTKSEGGTQFIKLDEGLDDRQVLTDIQITQLGLLVQRIYETIGMGQQHQDIEWVFNGNEYILVQTRPVTVLPRYTFPELQGQPDIWSNANYRDGMPFVQSTLNWSIGKNRAEIIQEGMCAPVSYKMLPGIQLSRLFQGRAYSNLSAVQWCSYDIFGISPKQNNLMLGGHQPEIEIREPNPYRGIKGLQRIWRNLKFFLFLQMVTRRAKNYFDYASRSAHKWHNKNFSSIEDSEFINIYEKRKA